MFSLNGLDPTNSGSGGAAALGTYRTSDAMSAVLADGYFNEGAGNLRWTKVLFVQASDDQGFVLIDSNGDQVTATAYDPGADDGIEWDTIPGKPAVVAAGATTAAARDSIGAGTSNLAIGTTASTAMAGNTVIPPALAPGTAVADATDETDVVAQFNALLASLRGNGVLQA